MAAKRKRPAHKKRGMTARLKNGRRVYWLGTFAFIGVLLAGFGAMVSAQLGLFILALCGACFAAYHELRQRRFWESSQDFKLRDLRNHHDMLVREVVRDQSDIKAIRHTLDAAARKLEAQEARFKSAGFDNARFVQNPQVLEVVESLRRTATAKRPSIYESTGLWEDDGISKVNAFNETAPPAGPIKPAAPPRNMRQRIPPRVANDAAQARFEEEVMDYSDMVVRELIHYALREGTIDVFTQPIVRLPQRKIRFYEMFARIRAKPGLYMPASRYLNVAAQDSLIHEIDAKLLMECLKTIETTAEVERAAPFFLNITAGTLKNGAFMKQLLDFLSQNRGLAPRLVFEIRQEEFANLEPVVLEILRGLGKLGCALSLDHVENLNFDIRFLQVLKVRYVKIDARTFLQKTRSETGYRDLLAMKRKLEGNGIGVIVEKVESEFALKEILDYDVHYGQGHLFGKPDRMAAYQKRGVA